MENLMINSVELAEMLGVTKRQASRVINEVNKELSEKGVYVFYTRPPRAPRKEVLRKIGIEN